MTEAPRTRSALRRALVWGAGSWLILRIISSLAAWFAVTSMHVGPTVGVPGYRPPTYTGIASILFAPWVRADALWYLSLSRNGYGGPGTFAFFPVMPLLTRMFTTAFGGDELVAGLVVASVACIVGFTALYLLVEALFDQRAARVVVAGLALFPTSFFLVSPYGEPLLMALGTLAILLAFRHRFAAAAVLAGLAALSRPFGVFIVLPLAAVALRSSGARLRWLPPAAALAAFVSWFAYAAVRTHDLIGLLRVQSLWQREPRFFPKTLVDGVSTWWTFRHSDVAPYFLFDAAAAIFGIVLVVATVWALRKDRLLGWGLASMGAACLILPMSSVFAGRPLLSMPRFVLALAPLFVGYVLLPRSLLIAGAVISAGGLAVASAVYVAARPLF